MSSLNKLTVIVITSLMAVVPLRNSYAEDNVVEPCKKIIVAGNIDWPPYTVLQEDTGYITGAGIELSRQIFNELDIPIEAVTFDNKLKMLHALHTGTIDLIVSTYAYEDIATVADILQPAYYYDPITVALNKRQVVDLDSWESLVGQAGIMSAGFYVDNATEAYFNNYLNINYNGSLLNMLQAVQAKEYDYAVGSYLQLKYSIEANVLKNSLAVAKHLSKSGDVHMAFSKSSVCQHYSSYLRKRLQDYKNNGKVEKLFKPYISN